MVQSISDFIPYSIIAGLNLNLWKTKGFPDSPEENQQYLRGLVLQFFAVIKSLAPLPQHVIYSDHHKHVLNTHCLVSIFWVTCRADFYSTVYQPAASFNVTKAATALCICNIAIIFTEYCCCIYDIM